MSRLKPDRKPPLAKSPIRLRPRRVLGSNSNVMQTPSGRSEIRFQQQADPILTGGSLRRSEKARRTSGTWEMEEADLRPEYQSISWELRALAKMVGDELGKENCDAADMDSDMKMNCGGGNSLVSSPLFERGRFYEQYSARRNERLNRKNKIQEAQTNSFSSTTASVSKFKSYNNKLGVTVESAKRSSFTSTTSSSSRKLQSSLRKSVVSALVETPIPTPTPIQRKSTSSQCEKQAPPTLIPTPTPRYMLRSMTNKENMKLPPLPQQPSRNNPKASAIRGGRKSGAPCSTPSRVVGGY
ncbi:unnamed protein product [Malus baccata var. baccata]